MWADSRKGEVGWKSPGVGAGHLQAVFLEDACS